MIFVCWHILFVCAYVCVFVVFVDFSFAYGLKHYNLAISCETTKHNKCLFLVINLKKNKINKTKKPNMSLF